MSSFDPGFYSAEIIYHEWREAKNDKKTPFLSLDLNVFNAQGDSKAMEAQIWFSPATMAPSHRKDGTLEVSFAQRQLQLVGYDGPLRDAHRRIGHDVDLTGHEVRVKLKEENYKGETRIVVGTFCDPHGGKLGKPADQDNLETVFADAQEPEPRAGEEQPEDPDDDDEDGKESDVPF